ncbi:hypothetical protein Plhal304r1_c086g0169141 [Plasmopara halstedii]
MGTHLRQNKTLQQRCSTLDSRFKKFPNLATKQNSNSTSLLMVQPESALSSRFELRFQQLHDALV